MLIIPVIFTIYALLSQFLFRRDLRTFTANFFAKIAITATFPAFIMYVCHMSYNANWVVDRLASIHTGQYRGAKKSQSWFFHQEIIHTTTHKQFHHPHDSAHYPLSYHKYHVCITARQLDGGQVARSSALVVRSHISSLN